ncbi:IclR family transcriptional regulator [Alsobacter soli]|uniref:IclR family transcriptional regulator n=1 Tax=Alsobacter soli TaxID=2109933 RepID=A0A2T1HR93_9HYPH|nr:helix-turn-helix domain-containing protein [Alsobacter soli]PSC04157.1 IclR family transcriptional regulator [Alsobacter soli]
MATKSSSTNAERAADILVVLGVAPDEGLSLSEIAARVGGAKPAAHRTLVALGSRGLVQPGTRKGFYRLGPALYALARSGNTAAAVARWKPALVGVAARTGHSTYLLARAGLDAVCLDVETGPGPIQTLTSGVGGRVPLGLGPGSLAILSVLPPSLQDTLLAANAERFRQDGRISADGVRMALARMAKTGIAIDEGALIPGVAGLATGIVDPLLGPVAISQALPAASLTAETQESFRLAVADLSPASP